MLVARAVRRQGLLQVRNASGMSAEEMEKRYIVPTYAKEGVRTKQGLVFESGSGSTLVASNGDEYLDMNSGIAVTVLGHNDQGWKNAVNEQLHKIVHTSNLYHTQPALDVAELLIQSAPGMGKVFFCNSGTEANEGAIKFARVYQNAVGESKRNRMVSFKKSFHGRTLGALSLTYKPAIREPFSPLLIPRVDIIDFNCIARLEEAIGPDVIALVMEPVQGEGGVAPASRAFVKRARELCDKHGVILIFDEVQIGLGRQGNGRVWSFQEHEGVIPDMVTMAKPISNGLPMGALMMSERMFSKVPSEKWLGSHGSTFAGNPVVAAGAREVLTRVTQPAFLARVAENGRHLIKGLEDMRQRLDGRVQEVRRPLGDAALYAGVQLNGAFVSKVISDCVENKVAVISAGDYGDVVRICPPLVITKPEIDRGLKVLEEAIRRHVPVGGASASQSDAAKPKFVVDMNRSSLASDDAAGYVRKLVEAGHTALPEGFRIGTASFEFFPEELPRTPQQKPAKMNLTVIAPEKPSPVYAALFTQNAFPGAPIKVGREMVASGKPLAGVVVNNKISNVSPRGSGVQDSIKVSAALTSLLGVDPAQANVLPCSTGVIGWRLPVDSMLQALPKAVSNLAGDSILPAAKGIMTTDNFPKSRSCVIRGADGTELGRFSGIAKGAGMIEPNMATMLVYILTDLDCDRAVLQRCLNKAVNADGSFNRISVDSDQSTSDTIIVLSSQKKARLPAQIEEEAIAMALSSLCSELAQDVVRNGEGTQHVMKVTVTGSPTAQLAHGVGKAVVNSPLVKTAVAGNDANVGRIIAAAGSYVGKHDPAFAKLMAEKCQIIVGDQVVFQNGEFTIDDKKEVKLAKILKDAELPPHADFPKHYTTVDIAIHLQGPERSMSEKFCVCKGVGTCKTLTHSTVVYGSDLTHDYIDVNGGYRS